LSLRHASKLQVDVFPFASNPCTPRSLHMLSCPSSPYPQPQPHTHTHIHTHTHTPPPPPETGRECDHLTACVFSYRKRMFIFMMLSISFLAFTEPKRNTPSSRSPNGSHPKPKRRQNEPTRATEEEEKQQRSERQIKMHNISQNGSLVKQQRSQNETPRAPEELEEQHSETQNGPEMKKQSQSKTEPKRNPTSDRGPRALHWHCTLPGAAHP
jgi:hypothetical protein